MNHKRRIDRLSEQIDFHMPTDDDDEIIVIRLVWPEQDPQPPIIYTRGDDGQLVCKPGAGPVAAHLGGPEMKIDMRWDDDITIVE